MLHGFGQRCNAQIIDAILRHVNFLQTAHNLENSNHMLGYMSFTSCSQKLYCPLYKDQKVRTECRGGVYLEGLSKGCSSIVLQPVPPCDKHLKAEGGALFRGFFIAVKQ